MSLPALLQHAETPTGAPWINGASSGTLAFGSTTAAKSLFVAKIKQVGSNVALNSVTDDQGNQWTVKPATLNGSTSTTQVAYALLTAGGSASTLTFNFAGAVAVALASISEWSNVQNIRDVNFISGLESNTGSSTAPSCQFQLGVAGDLLICIADGGTSNTHSQYTAPTVPALTGVPVQAATDANSFAWAWGIVTTQGFGSPTWTLGVSAAWSCICFSFAPPVAALPANPTRSSTFSGANQNPLAGSFSTWGSAGALKLVSNAVQATTTNTWCGAYWNADSFGDGTYQRSRITIGAADLSGSLRGPGVRMSANGQPTSGYVGIASGTGVYDMQRIVNGVGTIIGTAVASTVSIGDQVEITAFQNLITLVKNGVVLVCVYDTSAAAILQGGAPGIVFNEGGNPILASITSWDGGYGGDSRYYQGTVVGHDATNQNMQTGPFTVPNQAGSLLVACVGWPDASEPGTSVTDSQNNTWHQLNSSNLSPFGQTLWYCLNAKAGANTVTISRTANGHLPSTLGEYVNPTGAGWTLDTSTANNGSAANVTASLTTAAANELLIAYLGAVTNQSQGPVPGAAFRSALGSEIKLYDQNAPNAGSNTFSAKITNGTGGNGLPTTGQQEIMLAAFAPISGNSDDTTLPYIGCVTIAGSDAKGQQYIGKVRVITSPRAGAANPYLGNLYVAALPPGVNDTFLGEVTVVATPPAGYTGTDSYLGHMSEE